MRGLRGVAVVALLVVATFALGAGVASRILEGVWTGAAITAVTSGAVSLLLMVVATTAQPRLRESGFGSAGDMWAREAASMDRLSFKDMVERERLIADLESSMSRIQMLMTLEPDGELDEEFEALLRHIMQVGEELDARTDIDAITRRSLAQQLAAHLVEWREARWRGHRRGPRGTAP